MSRLFVSVGLALAISCAPQGTAPTSSAPTSRALSSVLTVTAPAIVAPTTTQTAAQTTAPTQVLTAAPTTAGPTTPPSVAPSAAPTAQPTAAPIINLCGAPANPWNYNFCGGAFISSPSSNFCSSFNCIASFWSGRGYVMECADLTYSKSGGIRGSCSYHGGNYRALYAP